MMGDVPSMTLLLVVMFVLFANMHRGGGIKLFIFIPILTGAVDDSGATEPIGLAAVKLFDVFRIVLIFKPLNRRGKESTCAVRLSTGTNRRGI